MLKNIIFIGVYSFILFFMGTTVHGAEIMKCKYLKKDGGKRCLVKAEGVENFNLGDKIIVYKNNIYWAGTGDIVKTKGNYALAVFKNSREVLTTGSRAEVHSPNQLKFQNWNTAFSEK